MLRGGRMRSAAGAEAVRNLGVADTGRVSLLTETH